LSKKIIFISLIWCCIICNAKSQSYEIHDLPSNFPSFNDDLKDLLIDSNNVLWILTSAELISYDGQSSQSFPNPFQSDFRHISELKDGSIWVSNGPQLAWLNNGQFNISDQKIGIIKSIGDRQLLSSNKGLFKNADSVWEKLAEEQNAMAILESDDLDFIVYKDEVYQRKLNQVRKILSSSDLFFSRISSASFAADNALMLHIENHGLYHYDAQNGLQSYPVSFDDRNLKIANVFYDKDLMFSTKDDQVFLQIDKYKFAPLIDGLSPNSIVKDQSGNLWIATGQKIVLLKPSLIEKLPFNDLLDINAVTALEKDCVGATLFGIENKGLYLLDPMEALSQTAWSRPISNKRITAIRKDANCHLWIGTGGSGLYHFDGFQIHQVAKGPGLGGSFVSDIEVDISGNVWVGLRDGALTKVQIDSTSQTGYVFQKITKGPIKNETLITDLYKDSKGRIWVASSNTGVHCFDGNELDYHYATAASGKYNPALSIVEIEGKGMLIATRQKAIHFLNTSDEPGAFTKFKMNSTFTKLLSIGDNRILGFDGNQLCELKLTAESLEKENCHQMAKLKLNDYLYNKEKDAILLATESGLRRLKIQEGKEEAIQHVGLKISDIKLNYVSIDFDENTQRSFEKNENNLGFFFQSSALDQSTEKYQWFLEGVDQDWSPWSEQKSVNYAGLSSGSYQFKVKSQNSQSVSTFKFNVKHAWWENKILQLAGLGFLLLALLSMIRFLINRGKKQAIEKNEKLAIENSLLSLKQQALQLQMNPHFIFNALTSIQNLVGQEDPKKARYYLAKFSRLMRNILEHSRKDFISLEEEMKLLDDYLSVEKLVHNDRFDFSIKADDNIDPSINIAPMMLQPFAENAVKYGASKVSDGKVEIDFHLKGKNIECTIKDNGPGFKENENKEHTSISMEVISERLALLQKNVKNHVNINSSDEGSIVQITLPIM